MKGIKCHLCFVSILVAGSFAEDLTLNVNFDEPIAVTDEKFLSLTIDPETLLTGNAFSTNFEKSINMARAMSPAYVRLERPAASFRSADSNVQDAGRNEIPKLSESDWISTNQWAKKAGLDVIACVSVDDRSDKIEDAMEIISFNDHMAFNTSWQLGYECQARCNVSADDFARQTMNLRKILNEFPRYSSSLVTGPDIVAYANEKQRQYLRDYFNIAGPALAAITWHPDFASVTLDDTGAFVEQDDLEKDKEELLGVIGRFVDKRPMWIAESKPEECKNLYIGALILTRRLGNAARSNINVFMRQPTDLTRPSADYWVCLLHKTLVGRKVFDAKTEISEKNHVYLYCQCTKPSSKYEKGSVTIFGVNLNPEEITIDFRGMKIDTVHEYILSPGFTSPNRMFSESVLLNNKTLNLLGNTVPDLMPDILSNQEGAKLRLHPGGIGFWVFPNLKIKSCMEDDKTPMEEEDLNSEEHVKIQVPRSVQDTSTLQTERERKISSRASRKSILRRELKKLRNFARRKLDDYDTAKVPLKPEDSSASRAESAGNSRATSTDDPRGPRNDVQNKLQEFKDRILRIRSLSRSDKTRSSIDKIVTDVSSLLSNVQNALRTTKREIESKTASNAKDHLKSLYDFLNRVDFNEPAIKRSEVVKRDLHGKRSRVSEKIRPSIVQMENRDSGSDEHAFYGFFKMKPVEGFPRGDVFFAAGDRPNGRNHRTDSNTPEYDYPDTDEPEKEYDYRVYGPNESFGKLEGWNRAKSTSAELWEVEVLEPGRKARSGRPNRRGSSARNGRDIVEKSRIFDFDENPSLEALDSANSDYDGRSKREIKDLDVILDQEMIKEDDANSKDCNCRVIRNTKICEGRSRRDATLSMATTTASEVESLNSHDMADVEVFSELKEAPLEEMRKDSGVHAEASPLDLEGSSSETIGVASVNPWNVYPDTLTTVPSFILNENTPLIETIPREGDTPLTESKKDDERATISDFAAIPIEATSASVQTDRPETLYVVTPSIPTSNEDRTLKTPIQRVRVTLNRKRPRKSRMRAPKSTTETILRENIGVNVRAIDSELRTTVPSLISAKEEDESPKTSIQRSTFVRETQENDQQTKNLYTEEIPITRDSINPEDFDHATTSFTLVSSELETPVETPVRRDGSQFFLANPTGTETKEIDSLAPEDHSSNSREKATASVGEEAAAGSIDEASGTTPLWEREMAKESEMDHDADQVTTVNVKREVLNEQAPNSSIQRSRFVRETQENDQQTKNLYTEEIPVTRDSINPEDFHHGTPTLTLVSSEVETPVRRNGNQFFLANPTKTETKEIDRLDPEDHSSSSRENSTASAGEVAATMDMEEASGTTPLWEREMAKESEMDHDADQVTAASAKREVVNEQLPETANLATRSSNKCSRRNRKQASNSSIKRLRSNVGKARESQLMQRAKVLSALSKMIRGKTGDKVYKLGAMSRRRNRARNSKTQTREAKVTFPDGKKTMLQSPRKSMDDEMAETNDEKRNLKRRQTWEVVEDDDDLRDVRDSEKMACLLVYKPTDNDDGSIGKRDASDEIVGERISDLDGQRDPTREHSRSPRTKTEIARLKELLKTRKIENSNDENAKRYFAMVEKLNRPRIFHFRKMEEKNENLKTTPRFHHNYDYAYNLPQRQVYRKEIYVIDPSEYRGGEPILRPFTNQWNPYIDRRSYAYSSPRNTGNIIRSVLRDTCKSCKTEHREWRDKVSEESDEFVETPESANTGQLLKILIDDLDLQSVEELFKQLNRYNTVNEKHNFIRSIFEEMKRKRSPDEPVVESEKVEQTSTEYSKGNESLEILNSEEMTGQTESYQNLSIEEDTRSDKEPDSSEVSIIQEHSYEETNRRRRRDTGSKPEKDYLPWLRSLSLQKPRLENPRRNNHLCSKESSGNSFNGSSKILDILTKNEERTAMPVKRSNLVDRVTVDCSSNILEGEANYGANNERTGTTNDRSRRQATDREIINENADTVQPSELQHLEGSSEQKNQTSMEMDDVEKSLVQKVPIERYTKKTDEKEDGGRGLPSLIQESIPSLQNIVIDGLQKAQNFTSSVEHLVENLDEKFDETTNSGEENDRDDSKSSSTAHTVFRHAIMNVKKFFGLLGGITRILRG